MSESAFDFPSPDKTSFREEPTRTEEPQFGVVDIVEAFTAMRHEWRGQTKESRELAEQMQTAVRKLEELETKRLARTAETPSDNPQELKQLARLVADTDHQLTRAVHAIGQAEENRKALEEADRRAIQRYFDGMNPVARWLARPLLAFCIECKTKDGGIENSSVEGLSLVLARLRQAMLEQGIERVDVLGQPFDGGTMNAIGTVDSLVYTTGHVAEQLAPCYRWKGSILRFADVRVAQTSTQKTE